MCPELKNSCIPVSCSMKLLIVAATEGEIGPLLNSGRDKAFDVQITGVGMVATAYTLTKYLTDNKYDLVLQAGVGGSYDKTIELGSLVFVTSEQYGDLGAEDHDDYLDIYDMGLKGKDEFPFQGGRLITPILPVHNNILLRRVSGLTVNTVSGNAETIRKRTEKFGSDIESMEGAAFHEVCLRENVPFAQVRAISNYVTPRNRAEWKMKEAIINLNEWLIDFIDSK